MAAPALLALALGALGVVAASPEAPPVSLSASDAVVRMPFNVTCGTGRAVPAANVTITAANRTWPLALSHDGHRATAEVTVTKQGTVRLSCTVLVGSRKLQTNTTIHVFNVPVPLLHVADAAEAGTEPGGSCSLPPGAASDIQVRVVARDGQELVGFTKPPAPFRLTVTEEDAERGLEVTCEASMKPFTPRSKAQRIRVLVKPRLDVELCPPQQNWTEGQEGVLTCSARGAPEPQVRCSKDGGSLTPGSVLAANRAHAGTYLCQATNELGTAERMVTVWVQYDDSLWLLSVLLGTLLPAAAVLGLAGLAWHLRRTQRIGEYRLWKRQPPPPGPGQPLRPPGSSAAAPNGSAAP